MELQIISLETSLLSKEVGFDWDTEKIWFHIKNDSKDKTLEDISQLLWKDALSWSHRQFPECHFPAPTQELLRKWLRDIHKIIISPIVFEKSDGKYACYIVDVNTNKDWYVREAWQDNYETSLELGFIEVLTYLKQKKNVTST